MRKLIWLPIFLLLASCDNSGDIWVHSGDSVNINGSTLSLTSHWYTMRENDDICAIYNSYFGGNLLSSTMYKGKVVNEKAEVYKVKKLYHIGVTVYENVDPTIITFNRKEMSVRIEIPDHVLDLNELSGGDDPSIPVHHVKGEIKIHSYVKVKNVKYLQDKIVNEKKECGKVL